MFKLVTSLDHWHNIYESSDSSAEFCRTPLQDVSRSRYPTTMLVEVPEGVGNRKFVVALMTDDVADHFAIESILRSRLQGLMDDLLSNDNVTRRRAMSKAIEVSKSVDAIMRRFAKPKKERPDRSRKLGLFAAGAVMVLMGVVFLSAIWKVVSDAQEDLDRREDEIGVRIDAGATTLEGILTEARSTKADLESIKGEVVRIRDEVIDVPSHAKTKVDEEMHRQQSQFNDRVETLKSEIKGMVTDVKQMESVVSSSVEEVRKILESAKKLRDSNREENVAVPRKDKFGSFVLNDGLKSGASDGADSEEDEGFTVSAESHSMPVELVGSLVSPVQTQGEEHLEALGRIPQAGGQLEERDPRVVRIQQFLTDRGYKPRGGADGIWGTNTQNAFLHWSRSEDRCVISTDALGFERVYECIFQVMQGE